MEPSSRAYVAEVVRLYKMGGLWFRPGQGRFGRLHPYLQVLRNVYYIVALVLMCLGAVQIGVIYFMSASSPYITLGIAVVGMDIPFFTGQAELRHFLAALDSSLARLRLPWQRELLRQEYARSKKLTNIYTFITCTFAFFFPLAGFLMDIVHYLLGKEIYVYPQCLDMYDTGVWGPRRVAISLLSYIWANMMSTQNVGMVGSMFVLTGLLRGELRVLTGMLQRLPPGEVWDMGEALRLHQELLRLHKMYTKLLGWPFAVQSIAGGINSCNLAISLLYQYQTGHAELFFMILTFALDFQGLLLISSLEGELLQARNEELAFALYNIPWFDQPKDVKKSIIMMIRQTQKPFYLAFKGNGPVNFQTYSQIMSTAYSCFNLYLKSL